MAPASPLRDANAFLELPRRHKFLDYASEHVTAHLGYTEIPELVPNLMGFVLLEAFIPWMEYFFMVVQL